ncbi:MAG: DUF1792 domain-containing protein [Selenomonadaceae bacterium]|nr:DUF1792 domain-containing protein [Selenomonadaceae bacterium]
MFKAYVTNPVFRNNIDLLMKVPIQEKDLQYPKDCIFEFILRSTATVLAYEMSNRGYIAYDIGHMAKDYNAFMNKEPRTPENSAKFFAPD